MKLSHITRRIALCMLATASAFAFAAPAQADPPPFHQLLTEAAASGGTSGQAVRPDDRATRVSPQPAQESTILRPAGWAYRPLGTGSPVSQVRPDDRANRSLPSAFAVSPTTADGFDWIDAGVGAAAGAFGLVLLMAGGMAVGHRLRQVAALP